MKISKVIFHIKPIPSHPWWECKNTHFNCLKSYYRDSRVEVTYLFLEWGHSANSVTHTSPKYMPLPSVHSFSEKLSGILQPFNIIIASHNVNDLSCFFKSTRDRIFKLDTADVIYNIPCSDCTATYIGTT